MTTYRLSAWSDLETLYLAVLEDLKKGRVSISGKEVPQNLTREKFGRLIEELINTREIRESVKEGYEYQLRDFLPR
jgi:hypothetical protein